MWDRVEYYTKPNGRQPAAEWIDGQDNSIRPSIDARINRLDKEGLSLSKEMLGPIKGEDSDLYELKHKGKKWRVAIYYDRKRDVFILLCGWRKTQQKQPRDIAMARKLLHQYLDMKGGAYG